MFLEFEVLNFYQNNATDEKTSLRDKILATFSLVYKFV